jgi:sortase A
MKPLRIAAACCLLGAAALFGEGVWTHTKAAVASVLIARSLDRTLRDGRPHPPWSWADFHPVARLRVPRLNVSQPILSGATGSTLAFGLGRVDGTEVAIAGHRDTWAAFLRDLRPGDRIVLTTHARERAYRVKTIRVVPPEAVEVLDTNGEDRLVLITCWPFGGLVRARQRLVVTCA